MTGVLRLRLYAVQDSQLGVEAFRFLMPSDWKVEGRVVWRANPNRPATVALRIFNSSRSKRNQNSSKSRRSNCLPYRNVWANASGDYIPGDNANFNPNFATNHPWRLLQANPQ
jgi:hypothetical protein